jgi:hypothetical protein
MIGEIWLYGSRARGDDDAFSDTDILVVGDLVAYDDVLPLPFDAADISVSQYGWPEIEAMWSYGSLFLHHLSREGRCIRRDPTHPRRMEQLLASVPRYRRAAQDLDAFGIAMAEALASLSNGGWPDVECGVIASITRHAAILGSYCLGTPSFSRQEPFVVSGRALGYGTAEIEALAAPAAAFRGGAIGEVYLSDDEVRWAKRAVAFITDLRPIVDAYNNRLLPSAD